jgi:crossover junction endodeoxyribonuclease RuvC
MLPIAGVDPSLTRTAICTGDASGHKITIIGTKAVGNGIAARFDRYGELIKGTIAGIGAAKFVFLEAYSFGSQGRSIVTLGEYGGALRKTLLVRGLEVVEVAPAALKKFVTGKGNAGKPEFIMASVKRWGVEFKGEDEYFAHGLFRIGLVYCRRAAAENKGQAEVVAMLRGKPV